MGRIEALALLTRYYAAFNAGDWQGMLDCFDDLRCSAAASIRPRSCI